MSLDIYLTAVRPTTVFESNITHKLTAMADAAGLYRALWRPNEMELVKAEQLIPILVAGRETLVTRRADMEALNPSNGWGSYDGLLRVVDEYLAACREHPDADISVSR